MKREKRKWLPAPLPLPATIGDMGILHLEDPAEVLRVTRDGDVGRAELRLDGHFFVYEGDTRELPEGGTHEFGPNDVLIVVGKTIVQSGRHTRDALVIRSDSMISLTPELRDVFGIK